MTRIIVGVLRGGTSSEYNLSLKTGAALIASLPEDRYDVRDILIDRAGLWHFRGQPATPARALSQIDVVLNALHGGVGEDGTVQRLLERAGVPYSGARPLPSAVALNKLRAREILHRADIRMPRAVSFTLENGLNTREMAEATFSEFGPPYMVKPPTDGAGRGIILARSIVELPHAIADVIDQYGAAVVEEFVRGEEASVGVIADFRGEPLYVLPPARVVYEGPHITAEHHETGALSYEVPSRFAYEQKLSLADMARRAHQALNLSHFSRSDFILTPRAIYLLEVNTVPGLYKGASFPHMLESVGSSIKEFAEHAVKLAHSRR